MLTVLQRFEKNAYIEFLENTINGLVDDIRSRIDRQTEAQTDEIDFHKRCPFFLLRKERLQIIFF
jgi:hypothetical protein